MEWGREPGGCGILASGEPSLRIPPPSPKNSPGRDHGSNSCGRERVCDRDLHVLDTQMRLFPFPVQASQDYYGPQVPDSQRDI